MKACSKIGFPTRGAANAYARRVKLVGGVGRHLRAYRCWWCRDWHLTSQSKAESRSARRKQQSRGEAA